MLDISGLEELGKKLEAASKGDMMDDFMPEFLLELVYRLDAKVKPRTPVDQGYLRRMFRIGDVKELPGGMYSIEYFNNTHYASYIENGHRTGKDKTGWVEGRFMLKISVQEIERDLQQFLDRKLEEALNKYFG
ncbi:HK97 gp10 family phage protein [Paenibacillus illinoisensis]|uniref:HK97 gp10 family phage protein n=1 Tax=Paenibacillus illinoisensis TaxID=59845 RepID=UPI00301C8593